MRRGYSAAFAFILGTRSGGGVARMAEHLKTWAFIIVLAPLAMLAVLACAWLERWQADEDKPDYDA